MTTYTAISDTQVAVDAPLTQQLMQALKDNNTATAEGSAGAPRIQHVALEGSDTTPVAGNVIIAETSAMLHSAKSPALKIIIRVTGEYKFSWQVFNFSQVGDTASRFTVQMERLRGASVLNLGSAQNVDDNEFKTHSDNYSLQAGDEVYLDVDETAFHAVGTFRLTCSVADTNAISGVQAYSVLT